MHKEQKQFCRKVKAKYWKKFLFSRVFDIGSLDVNGTNRYLFLRPRYKGIDIVNGKNVDIVGRAKDVLPGLGQADVVISTEMLEHDATWRESLIAMYHATKSGGLLIVTAAGVGRREHGTHEHSPQDSPGTNDYYQNMDFAMFSSMLPPYFFKEYYLNHDDRQNDFQFYGIKK